MYVHHSSLTLGWTHLENREQIPKFLWFLHVTGCQVRMKLLSFLPWDANFVLNNLQVTLQVTALEAITSPCHRWVWEFTQRSGLPYQQLSEGVGVSAVTHLKASEQCRSTSTAWGSVMQTQTRSAQHPDADELDCSPPRDQAQSEGIPNNHHCVSRIYLIAAK
jgi:transposase